LPGFAAPIGCISGILSSFANDQASVRRAFAGPPPRVLPSSTLAAMNPLDRDSPFYETHDRVPVELARIVDEGLGRANDGAAPLHGVEGLSCFARLASGALVGGAVGRTWGECCELQQLWVRDDHRRRGIGSALMARFEARAVARGCRTLYLETWSFQAPAFYRPRGHEVALETRGFPDDIAKYVLVRRLEPAAFRATRSAEPPRAVARMPAPPDTRSAIDPAVELRFGDVLLRPYRDGDAAQLYAAVRESLPTVGRWMTWCREGYAQGDAVAWVERCATAWQSGEEYAFGIFDARGDYVGATGLNHFNRVHNFANLGYWVRQSRQREGFAATAARLSADFGFAALRLTRIEIVAAAENRPSRRVAEKLGAQFECVARNRLLLRGVPIAGAVYSVVPDAAA